MSKFMIIICVMGLAACACMDMEDGFLSLNGPFTTTVRIDKYIVGIYHAVHAGWTPSLTAPRGAGYGCCMTEEAYLQLNSDKTFIMRFSIKNMGNSNVYKRSMTGTFELAVPEEFLSKEEHDSYCRGNLKMISADGTFFGEFSMSTSSYAHKNFS